MNEATTHEPSATPADTVTELRVRRDNLRETVLHRRGRTALDDGEVFVEVEKFALTANNVSYGVSGDMIGYWRYYPVEDPWGIIPVWGFARVVESRCAELPVGERFWGFLPMASHATLRPAAVKPGSFVDDTPHRRDLPSLYNAYQRTGGDRPPLSEMEDERCVLVPLFTTSFVLCDWLGDNAWFGARQVLIGSASSKTGLGLANLLSRVPGHPVRVVGLTSPSNRAFVEALGTCDEVVPYDAVGGLDGSVPTAFVDMAGSSAVRRAVHERFGDNLVNSCVVGVTHWDAKRERGALPGATPTFFFAPGQILKREEDWGPGEILRRAMAESLRIAVEMRGRMEIVRDRGPEACKAALDEMVAGLTPPSRARMLSLGEA